MYAFVELEVIDGQSTFTTLDSCRDFLERAASCGAAFGAEVLAFRLEPWRAGLLVRCQRAQVQRWTGHMRAGHALRRRHLGGSVTWGPPAIIPLPGPELAYDFALGLHRLGADPLAAQGCSLRDAIGLREAPWFDPTWLRSQARPEEWLSAAGVELPRPPAMTLCSPLPFADWWQVDAAVQASTGSDPDARAQSVLRVQLAWRCGWTLEALAAITGVGVPAVRRALRCPPRSPLTAAMAWIREPRLRARLVRAPERRPVFDRGWAGPSPLRPSQPRGLPIISASA